MAKQKFLFSANGYLPKLTITKLKEFEDLKKFLEERKPEYFIKIREKEIGLTRYYFFNRISYGFLEE